ncbi:MAG TPA: CAAX prenyl protease-related protein [Usitatibacter sp.]|nr:CAAX prenyl protease-related protein [Usitatibacter sp.]
MSSIAPRRSARRSRFASSIRSLAPALARIAPFALFLAFLAVQPLLEPTLDARWIAVARGLAVAALLAYFWRHYTELKRPGAVPVPAREWALAMFLGIAVFGAWITFDSGWAAFESRGPGFVPLRPDGTLDPALVALRLCALALVVPVMEELFWRSFLMRWIGKREFLAADPRKVGLVAFGISSALFASEHALWFAGLLAGLAYGWTYLRTGNLWVPIVSHAITNGLLGVWILATQNWRYW